MRIGGLLMRFLALLIGFSRLCAIEDPKALSGDVVGAGKCLRLVAVDHSLATVSSSSRRRAGRRRGYRLEARRRPL